MSKFLCMPMLSKASCLRSTLHLRTHEAMLRRVLWCRHLEEVDTQNGVCGVQNGPSADWFSLIFHLIMIRVSCFALSHGIQLFFGQHFFCLCSTRNLINESKEGEFFLVLSLLCVKVVELAKLGDLHFESILGGSILNLFTNGSPGEKCIWVTICINARTRKSGRILVRLKIGWRVMDSKWRVVCAYCNRWVAQFASICDLLLFICK